MIRTALMLFALAVGGCGTSRTAGTPRQQTFARGTTAQKATDRALPAPYEQPPLKQQELEQRTTPLTGQGTPNQGPEPRP